MGSSLKRTASLPPEDSLFLEDESPFSSPYWCGLTSERSIFSVVTLLLLVILGKPGFSIKTPCFWFKKNENVGIFIATCHLSFPDVFFFFFPG